MAEFYSARGWEIPPLPWTNLSPPFSPEVGAGWFNDHVRICGGVRSNTHSYRNRGAGRSNAPAYSAPHNYDRHAL